MRSPNVANRKEAVFDTGVARRGRGELAPGRNEPELAVRIEVAAREGEGLQTRLSGAGGEGETVLARDDVAASEGEGLQTRLSVAAGEGETLRTRDDVAASEATAVKAWQCGAGGEGGR